MVIHLLLLCNLYITHTWSLVLLQRNIVWISDFKRNDVHFPSNLEFLFLWQVNPYFISTLMFVSNIMPRYVNVLFFYVKKSRSSKAEQLFIQVNGIIILYLPILIGSLICGPRQPDHARWCVSYNVYRSVNFFFHYSIMYYNMYCYHVASIHNQSWTGLLIMETVDQIVSCNLVGVFFFSISMQSFIVQLSEIRNFMISFVITSKYLHVYDKEIFDLKPMGHAFTCHVG